MANHYFAVDIGGTAVKYALISPDYRILEKNSFPTPYDTAQTLVDSIFRAAEPFRGMLAGVGVSVPGTINDDEDGTVHRGGSLTYMDGVPLGRILSETFGLPCAVENDGKASALGEYANGALTGHRSGVVMVLGTGVGGGIVLDGKLWKGIHCFAGEFSYLNPTSTVQTIEQMFGHLGGASGLRSAVLRHKGLPPETMLSGYEIFSLANSGEEAVIAGIREYAAGLAIQIYNLQAILDPEVIAIGGGISSQPLLLQLIREELDRCYGQLPDVLMPPRATVVAAKNGNDANLLGAAYRCAQR